ncbi:type VI secretion system contractile sheath domain-containing protein [Simiduia aestuariiviva]|uniref:Type VI secretion system protein ImpC n=1 Tax=Simiduia aestuariiviva TaxID=1510459 RepID=A0A839UGB9_9GAMM|nr:type VI secretion system contractile sheath large subunit [Simiduia aestuariiviva]MBB3167094.1 type VI secretion system protein ImpC [Simiduia aestuariiviva]
MTRVTMSTGGVVFGSGTGYDPEDNHRVATDDSGQPMHMIFMGDFSGRGSRGDIDMASLANRPLREINRDNFDDVFAALNVRLQLPTCASPIAFEDLDDLHPDTLYRRVPLFHRLRELTAQLNNPAQFAQAAADIQSWTVTEAPQQVTGMAIPEGLFDRPAAKEANRRGEAQDVNDFIRQIVAPFVEPKSDPRAAELTATLERVAANALRNLMHAGDFQRLEANWRSVNLLVRRLETGKNLKLFLLDVSEEELRADFSASDDITQAALYQRLISSFQMPGATPWSVLVSDVTLTDEVADVRLAAGLSALAVYADAIALVSGHERIAGCASLAQTPDVADWQHPVNAQFAKLWQALRDEPQSDSLLVAAPRFLLRLPYGARTAPIESFGFEELGADGAHGHYLWGNGAYAVALLMGQSFEQNYWDFASGLVTRLSDLPLHIYADEDGDAVAKACAEIYMTDTTAAALLTAGLCPLRSVKGDGAVLMQGFNALVAGGQSVLEVITA